MAALILKEMTGSCFVVLRPLLVKSTRETSLMSILKFQDPLTPMGLGAALAVELLRARPCVPPPIRSRQRRIPLEEFSGRHRPLHALSLLCRAFVQIGVEVIRMGRKRRLSAASPRGPDLRLCRLI